MSKKKGCRVGSILHHGRCVKLKKEQLWLDQNRFRDNHFKILKIDIKNKKIRGAYLDDSGIFGFDKKGVQHEDKIYERPVQKKTFSFNKFNEKNMDLIS